jgi:hypothetical protein
MGIEDIDTELSKIRMPGIKRKRGPDLNVPNAEIKAIVARILALVFLLSIAGLGLFLMLKTREDTGSISSFILIVAVIYLLLGAYVSYKLLKLEYLGWALVFFTSVAGILLPAMTMITHGISTGLLAIAVVCVAIILVLWWIKDLFGIKGLKNIFNPQ